MINKKIVIVEDNASLNELYTMGFSNAGFEVVSCLDGEKVESVIFKLKPQIILLDIMMPKIDGLEVLKRVKSNKSLDCMVVVASNLLNDSIMKEALHLGAIDFLNKSDYTPTEMVKKVSSYLEK